MQGLRPPEDYATADAETGDLRRFATGRAVVKHAGLAPRENLSGAFTGRTKLTGHGRPALRLAPWRAVWGASAQSPSTGRATST
jgi:transposase